MSTPVSASFIRRCLCKITADCSLLKTLPNTTCAICMDDFMCQDMLLVLPTCHHIFHRKCILPWFSRNNTCPLCRRVFPPEQRRMYSVLLRTHSHHLRQQPPFSQQPRDTVFRLNFHLRPLSLESSSTNSDYQPSLLPATTLERMLRSEGFSQLATQACGPFWISADSSRNVPLPASRPSN